MAPSAGADDVIVVGKGSGMTGARGPGEHETLITGDELARMPDHELCELVDGRIKEKAMSLAGKWKMVSTTQCGNGYPDEIEFFARPRYLASKGPGQGFISIFAGSSFS